jgi:hypothetical protein
MRRVYVYPDMASHVNSAGMSRAQRVRRAFAFTVFVCFLPPEEAARMLSTRLGYRRPARCALARADAFWSGVSFVEPVRGFFRFQGGFLSEGDIGWRVQGSRV